MEIKNKTEKKMKDLLNSICHSFSKSIMEMDIESAEAALIIVKQYNTTNCPAINYWMKGFLIEYIGRHLEVLRISQIC